MSSMGSRISSVLFTPFCPIPKMTLVLRKDSKAFTELPIYCHSMRQSGGGLVFIVFHQIFSINFTLCSNYFAFLLEDIS